MTRQGTLLPVIREAVEHFDERFDVVLERTGRRGARHTSARPAALMT
jgi:hypothetical protein